MVRPCTKSAAGEPLALVISIAAVPCKTSVLLTVSVPMPPAPGESVPPPLTVTAPPIAPVPPREPPLATVTAPLPVPDPVVLVTVSSPPLIEVVPV